MTHIAGYPKRYHPRVRSLIEQYQPKLVICGHSHLLKVMNDKQYGHLHMNPGAAGTHGFHKVRTGLQFEIDNHQIKNLKVIEFGARGAVNK
jgi:predicted phosphodiesterase